MQIRARKQHRVGGGAKVSAAAWLAWSLACLTVAMSAASIVLFFLARSVHVPSSWDTSSSSASDDLLFFASFLAFPLVGALIASKRPQNPIGWICLADGLVWALLALIEDYSVYGLAAPGALPFPVGIYALTAWMWVPAVGLVGTYLLLLFPDGSLPSRRWRPLAWLCGAEMVLLSAAVVLTPGPLDGLGGARNPFGLEGLPWVAGAFWVLLPLLPVCILVSALSLVLRYRRSGGEVREQIKWIAFAASLMGVVFLGVVASSPASPEDGAPGLSQYLLVLSFAAIPVAIGISVLKYRLYDIDLLINRALVYGVMTAILAALYLGGVVVLQAVVRAVSGQESQLAVVASTLAIAALFNPLRRRVQALVDRRFYRRRYDAARTLAAFSARLRDETDLDALRDDVVGVALGTMQPEHASLWLRPDPTTKDGALD